MSLSFSRYFVVLLVLVAVLSPLPAVQGQSLTFTTLAGPGGGAGSEDGTGIAARFRGPAGVATDASGNLYVADQFNHTIRKITPAGAVTTLAGLARTQGSDDGTGSAARFSGPAGVTTDLSGNVYVADQYNNTIRKITPGGVVTTLAGFAGRAGSADGSGSEARFDFPYGVATDSRGNVYVADVGNSTIRKITPDGVVTTLAGLARSGGSNDGRGSLARFRNPWGIATDRNGIVYVADTDNSTIRKITPSGAVTTLAGVAGSSGNFNGTASSVRFRTPRGLATDSRGNVYVADSGNRALRKITPAGAVTTLAGSPPGVPQNDGGTALDGPRGVATDSAGNVYVTDANNTIRKITSAGMVTTLAGLEGPGGRADGTRSTARFNSPQGLSTDSLGNIYVADQYNQTIRKITPEGVVTTLAGSAGAPGSADGTGSAARFNGPAGVATDLTGNVYVADTFNATIRKITPDGAVTTLAGLPGRYGKADGRGSAAEFDSPSAVATDSDGNIYVADTYSSTIRKITADGEVTTFAGFARSFGSADGTGSTARFINPRGIATDRSGNVYVTDSGNFTIRKITAAGEVTTVAGLAGSFGSADGTGSEARFDFRAFGWEEDDYSGALATDSDGNVYVADSHNHTIRKITPSGEVTTLGGLAGRAGNAEGTGSAARFADPRGVAVDSSGNLFLADTGNNKIRVGKVALADVAVVDVPTGSRGTTRQLDTSPQTATSWEWSVIRRPADSIALLSSGSVRNPTFTPDVPGLFTFRLIATGPGGSSITLVDLNASGTSERTPRRRVVRTPPSALHGSIWGNVVTGSGACLPGAVVEVLDGALAGARATQSECIGPWDYGDGGYSFRALPPDTNVRLRASKEGYQSREMTVLATSGPATETRFVLAPE